MRSLPWLALLALLAARSAAPGATLLYLDSEGLDEPVAAGRRLRFASPALEVDATDVGGLWGIATDQSSGTRYFIYLVPPAGQRFAPGSYEGAAGCGYTTAPGICVLHEYYGRPTAGHVEIVDVAYDAQNRLTQLAAEFSQDGATPGTHLAGSIRFASGDATCTGMPDGTPCDDRDACSSASACTSGTCRATDTAPCTDPAAGPCRDAPVCDPSAGICRAPTFWRDGTACPNLDQCALTSYCASGVCTAHLPRTCVDYDGCTDDVCDTHAGCEYPAAPGACGRPGLPGSYFFVGRSPVGPAGDGLPVLLTPGLDWSIGSGDDGTLSVSAQDASFGYWSATFFPPPGATLVPGTYENVASESYARAPGQAALETSGGVYCSPSQDRFVVHEASTHFLEGDRGQAVTFAADFERRCVDSGVTFTGVVRIRTGDAACIGAADGTPCDDLNACTGSSTCQAGSCRGADPVVCSTAGPCHAAPICDPSTGACLDAPAFADGTACDDPGTCIRGGTCTSGVCTTDTRPCNDANPCTTDRCDGGFACRHETIAGCWLVAERERVTANARGSLQGHDVACSLRCQRLGHDVLLLGDDAYRMLSGRVTCTDGTTARVPDEIGTVRRTRSGVLRLRMSNADEIRRMLRDCQHRKASFSRRQSLQLSADGHDFTGVSRFHSTTASQLPIDQTIVAHLSGRLGVEPEPLELAPQPHVCPDRLVLRCVER